MPRKAFYVLVIGLLCGMFTLRATANEVVNADDLNPVIILGNDNDVTYTDCTGEKIESPTAGSEYLFANGNIIAKVSEDLKYVEVQELSTLYEICYIHVKGGDAYHQYYVPMEVSHIVNLQSPPNKGGNVPEISHFTIFWKLKEVVPPDPKFSLTIHKVYMDYVLEGAIFRLEGMGANIVSPPSNEDGSIVFTNLDKGTYTLTEITAPTGYMLLNSPITVTVEEDVAITVTNYPSDEPPDTAAEDYLWWWVTAALLAFVGLILLNKGGRD